MSKLLSLFLLLSIFISCTAEDDSEDFLAEDKKKKKKNKNNDDDNDEPNITMGCTDPLEVKDELTINFNYPWELPQDIEVQLNNNVIFSTCKDIANNSLSWIDETFFEIEAELKNMSLLKYYELTVWDVKDCEPPKLISNTPEVPVYLKTKYKTICDKEYKYQIGTINYL